MTGQRLRSVIEDLEQLLLEFISSHQITHDEYRRATDLIIATIEAGERSLLFDVFLEARTTDVGGAGDPATVEAVEGPFYLPDAPELRPPYVMPGCSATNENTLLFSGRVCAPDGAPLAGVEIDMWQADGAGGYSSFAPGVPDGMLRGRFRTAADGTFEVTTVMPAPYEIPSRGPTGQLMRALGRHCYRPHTST